MNTSIGATGVASLITCGISLGGAASGQVSDINPDEIGNGVYKFNITANETNADHIVVVPIIATGHILADPKEYLTRSVTPSVNAIQIGSSTTAADNLVLDYNGTGYNKSASTIGTATRVFEKGGWQLATSGLDYISVTAPSTVATTFPGMVVQVWRRWFKKSTIHATNGLITYADNGSTAVTTQTVSDDGTTQTIGPAT